MGGGEQWAWELAATQGLMGEAERGGTAEDHLGGRAGHTSASTLKGPRCKPECWETWGNVRSGEGGVVLRSCDWWAAKSLGWNRTKPGLLGLALAICAPRVPGGLLLAERTGGAVEKKSGKRGRGRLGVRLGLAPDSDLKLSGSRLFPSNPAWIPHTETECQFTALSRAPFP